MRGTVDEPIIKYDTKSVKEKIKESFAKEKKELIKVFKEEFTHKKEEEEVKDWDPPEEDEFIDWDEEEDSLNLNEEM